MKKSLNIISIFLICLMVLSTTPLIFGSYASASTCAANFLPNYYVPYTPDGIPLDTATEVTLSGSVADYITSVLNSKYPIFDRRNLDCTDTYFESILSSLQSYDNAVIYTKGHRNAYSSNGYTHYGLIMNNGATVWDYEIYPLTSSKNVNTFVWHCQTAIIPAFGYESGVGYCGLPIAFTHNTGISSTKWGSSGSQVYLGWTDAVPQYPYPLTAGSPQYTWSINNNYNYAQVAAMYYYYVGQGYSTIGALNELCKTIYGTAYPYASTSCQLHYWLVYYGNGDLGLP
jgi:hypothetical protein